MFMFATGRDMLAAQQGTVCRRLKFTHVCNLGIVQSQRTTFKAPSPSEFRNVPQIIVLIDWLKQIFLHI